MPEHLSETVLNNARWCDTMCRLHGNPGRFEPGWWSVPRRPPTFYPDAVTLEPGTTASPILGSIDASPGCSVKDSYADLDLTSFGFRELFSARWISRTAGADAGAGGSDDLQWTRVESPEGLITWERAWAAEAEPTGLFRPELLANEDVAAIAGIRDGRIVAGGIAFRTGSVVALTNVFSTQDDLDAAWHGCSTFTSERFPDVPIVGYERGPALEAAERHGFRRTGALRVWFKPDAP
jgi:hypothetical protein